MAPFLGALAVIVLAVIVVVLLNSFGTDGRSEEQKVSLAAVGQNDALQRENFSEFSGYTCAAQRGAEADFIARQRDSVAKQGATVRRRRDWGEGRGGSGHRNRGLPLRQYA